MDITSYRKYVVKTPPDNVKVKEPPYNLCGTMSTRKMKTGAYRESPYSCKMEFKVHDEPWEQVCHRVPAGPGGRVLEGRPNQYWCDFGLLPKKILKLWLEGHTYDVGRTRWSWNRPKICIGYRLKNNPSVFRPIFNQKLQLNIILFQKNIKRVVDKRMEKHVYIELFKIKQFPKVIVDKIFKMVY